MAEKLDSLQTNTVNKTFAFRTPGTLKNHGSQAFYKLWFSANQFYNYGTIQMWTYRFFHNYSFNSGVLKSDEKPTGIADLRTEKLKNSTAKPNYRYGIIDNYGLEIVSGTLRIQGGLSYIEHGEGVFENLQMSGGDIVVNNGSTNISGKLTGTIHNMSANCQGSLYINEYDATRTGNYFTGGGTIYTSDAHHKKIVQDVTDLSQEESLLKKLEKATRVTPEKAYERYLLIKQGKENQVYSRATMNDIEKAHPNDWKVIAAMKEWGLPGGGTVGLAVVGAGLGYGLDRAFNRHHHHADVRATIGIDHRGNIAGGFNSQSVNWQLGNRRRQQDQLTTQITETFNKDPYVQLPRKNKNHEYWKELEALPRKVKLKKELQTLFKPESEYSYSAHNYRSSPWLQIYDARHMEVDTTQYQTNRTYCSKLYKSMRNAGIQHSDILAVWGNPYIGTVTKWDALSWQRQESILKDYPDTARIADYIDEAKQNLTLDLAMTDYTTRDFINDMVLVTSAIALDFMCPPSSAYTTLVVATSSVRVMARLAPKLGTVAAGLGLEAQRLYNKADNFFKKKASESAKPRIQNTQETQINFVKRHQNSGIWQKSSKRVGGTRNVVR